MLHYFSPLYAISQLPPRLSCIVHWQGYFYTMDEGNQDFHRLFQSAKVYMRYIYDDLLATQTLLFALKTHHLAARL